MYTIHSIWYYENGIPVLLLRKAIIIIIILLGLPFDSKNTGVEEMTLRNVKKQCGTTTGLKM